MKKDLFQNIVMIRQDQYKEHPFAQKELLLEEINTPFGTVLTAWANDHLCCWLSFQTDKSEAIAKYYPLNSIKYNDRPARNYHKLISDETSIVLKGTPFQLSVWDATYRIAKGQTKSYGDIAHAIGNTQSARAVGNALNKNPVALLIPCHRVIASSGRLGGFAYQCSLKEQLLKAEAA